MYTSVVISLALLCMTHHTVSQQSQQLYSQKSAVQDGKVQLEDVERENYKGQQPEAYSSQTQSQSVYSGQPQYTAQSQILPYTTQGQLASYAAQSQQPSVPLFSPQYILPSYLTPQSYQVPFDFNNIPGVSYVPTPASAIYQQYYVPQSPQGVINPADYFKASAQAGVKSQSPVTSLKSVVSPNAQTAQNYAIPQQYYQAVPYQPQDAASPFYYAYQSQYSPKSVYSSGIKSTTPSVPLKGRDESYSQIGNTFKYDFPRGEQATGFSKVRIAG